MKKTQFNLIISLMLILTFVGFISADYPAPFTTGGNSQNQDDNPAKYVKCQEGYQVASYTEESSASPSGFSTTYYCKKIGNIVLGISSGPNENSEPNKDSDVVVVSQDPQQSEEKERSQEEIDCQKKGCFMDNVCYPFGSIKDGTACSQKGKLIGTYAYPAFVNQSEIGITCNQGYECKSGVCSNGLCIDLGNVTSEISSLKNDLVALSQQNTELNSSLLETQQSVEESNNLLQKIANFLKEWFGFS